jgi:uncharacterized protein (DUF362 family)
VTSRIKVSRVAAAGELQESVNRALDLLGADVRQGLNNSRVLIKANFNSPDPYPASSDPFFLVALVDVLRRAGASHIAFGDSCGLRWAPAEEVHHRLGVPELAARLGVTHLNFDYGPWREITINSRHFETVSIAESAFKFDKIVYAACMKTHRHARFSLSLKHTAGFLSPPDRRRLHFGNLEGNVGDINQAVKPDIVFLDARKCFVTGGPARGWVRRPNLIMASTDRIALDVEALKVLKSFFAFNRLYRNPWEHIQIRRAVALGLGVSSASDYDVVRG